ncbi:MAG: hypothetical protein K2K35_12060 [Lachnospiraceae bacterium]|nr:hypothetical protein [Lachnospiraceae bacterium]
MCNGFKAGISLNSISGIVSGIKLGETVGNFLADTRTDTIIGHHNQEMAGKELVNTGTGILNTASI